MTTSNITAQLISTFPANVSGTGGITVDKNGGAFEIGLDLDAYSAAQGSLLARGVDAWEGVPPGPAGYAWISNGPGENGSYQPLPGNLSSSFSPEQFGAIGDGVADDTAAFLSLTTAVQNAGGGTIIFGFGKVYKVWPALTAGTANLLDFYDLDYLVIDFNGSRIETDSTFTSGIYANVMRFTNCKGVRIISPWFVQTVTKTLEAFDYGSAFITLVDECIDFDIFNLTQDGGRIGLTVARSAFFDPTKRARGIILYGATFQNVYYAQSFQLNGDNYEGRAIFCRNVGRAYFPRNVGHHDVWIDSNGGGPFADLQLSVTCYSDPAESNTLSDLTIKYRNRERGTATPASAICQLAMAQGDATTASGRMHCIDIHFDIDNVNGATNPQPQLVETAKFDSTGAVENTVRGYDVIDLTFSGTAYNYNYGVDLANLFDPATGDYTGEQIRNIFFQKMYMTSSSTQKFKVNCQPFKGNLGLLEISAPTVDLEITNFNRVRVKLGDATVFNNRFTGTFSAPVTWGQTAGTGPTIGNGSLNATVTRQGQLQSVDIALGMGSTTTFGDGTGDWTFTLAAPFDGAAVQAAVGSAWVRDSTGNLRYIGATSITTGGTFITVYANATLAGWRSNVPFTWASGNEAYLSLQYEVTG